MAKIYSIILLSLFSLVVPWPADAATLVLSPSSDSLTVGSSFSVNVYVSSAGEVMNAASGMVSFPQDKLEIVSLSKEGSIFSLWVQEPSFSNDAGTMNFEGIVLNPGFTGASGKILAITFKAKTAGTANVLFSSGSILANDGQGTNILTGMSSGQYSIETAASPPAVKPKPAGSSSQAESDVSGVLEIRSSTHPDQDAWYSNKTVHFTWDLDSDITAVRLGYDSSPAPPRVLYQPPVLEKELTLEDGVTYFAVQAREAVGWGPITQYRVQIDTEPPRLAKVNITYDPEKSALILQVAAVSVFDTEEGGSLSLEAKAADAISGIARFALLVDGEEFTTIEPGKFTNDTHVVPVHLSPGTHTATLRVFDEAGNATDSEKASFETVQPSNSMEIFMKNVGSIGYALFLLALLITFILGAIFGRFYTKPRRRLSKHDTLHDVDTEVHKEFLKLRERINHSIAKLEKESDTRELTATEARFVKEMTSAIKEAEKVIEKDVQDVEK